MSNYAPESTDFNTVYEGMEPPLTWPTELPTSAPKRGEKLSEVLKKALDGWIKSVAQYRKQGARTESGR